MEDGGSMMNNKVAVVGKGAREHALCWKLSQCERVDTVYAICGNGGTVNAGENIKNVNVDYNIESIVQWCAEHKIDLVVIGPEQFLAEGIQNSLAERGIQCFGPSKKASLIETDKSWSKQFMHDVGIPTAISRSFHRAEEAVKYVEQNFRENEKIVVKASGLAQGKGVFICNSRDEAKACIDDMMTLGSLGNAGKTVVIEEYLEGEEVSILAFCDGNDFVVMLPAQDHKRLKDNDEGPNTGGMGAVCPYFVPKEDMNFVKNEIFTKALHGMRARDCPFVGILYAGLILTNDGIKVLEFNCRFGDPETQVLMPLLRSDLFDIFEACCKGKLSKLDIKWSDECSIGVVMASAGYPISASAEVVIQGVPLSTDESGLYVFHAATEFKNDRYYAKSGRILTAVATGSSIPMASTKAKRLCASIIFAGCQFRSDIGDRAIARYLLKRGSNTYKLSGVDISSGNELVNKLKTIVKSTHNRNVVTPLGSFAAAYDLRLTDYKSPLLVTGCDGVGTKMKIAEICNNYSTIGQDLVAMSVNDILALGAKPLFFLDYVACGSLNVDKTLLILEGIVEGCKKANCALIGGETAEMPGVFKKNEYELAGFVVGVVENETILPSRNLSAGDVLVCLPSSGAHSNGFSLIRKIMNDRNLSYDDIAPFSDAGLTYGEEFLKPTTIYTEIVLDLVKRSEIKAFAHITGGGLPENVVRVLPNDMKIQLDASKWKIPAIFGWVAAVGEVPEYEILRTFNCGVGGILVVNSRDAEEVARLVNSNVIGELKPRKKGEQQFEIQNFDAQLRKSMNPFIRTLTSLQVSRVTRVAVFISGTGSNLQTLINETSSSWSTVQIVLVISDKANAGGIEIAKRHKIRVEVIERKSKENREDHEARIQSVLKNEKIDLICLAGYMKILTESFVKAWRGKLINIHPSLLPSFKGCKAQQQAINAGVKFSGCTVHFVEPDVDAGAIIMQGIVEVKPEDSEDDLIERIKEVEHEIYPKALNLVASGKIVLDLQSGKISRT